MHKRIVLLIAFISALSGSISGFVVQQETSNAGLLRLRADLVTVDVLATQRKTGRILSNLTKEDFLIYEDGVNQNISHFGRDELPVSVLLLVDRAGCVNAFNEQIRAATIEAMSRLKPDTEVAIMTFSNKVALVQPFTRDRKLIADKILSVEIQHESEQHYFNMAIYEAAIYMSQSANPAGRRAIIALTSLEASIDFSKRSEKEALHAVLESGASVSAILVKTLGGRLEQIFRGKPTSILRHLGLRSGSIKKFVQETGGELAHARPEEIGTTLTRIMNNLAASYSIAYTPTNPTRDGKRRRIRVSLSPEAEKRAGKTALRARRSYVMPKENPPAELPKTK
ncbi:MAG: VWA domain-containing protein [Blastocatellia bacterium]|nr:VWA domain-containing protein [Blastocatellia bacterium]